MKYADKLLFAALHKQLLIQLVLIVITALLFALQSWNSSLAAAWGGAIAIVNTLLQQRAVHKAVQQASLDAGKSFKYAVQAVVERFAVTVILLGLGLGMFKLLPLPLLTGFIAGQFALLGSGLKFKRK